MSIDKDPEVFNLFVIIILGLIGSIGAYRLRIVKEMKKNTEIALKMAHKNKEDIIEIQTICKERDKRKK